MKQTKEQVIENLNNINYRVLFTKEELIDIVESIEEPKNDVEIPPFDFQKIRKDVTECVMDVLSNMDTDDLIRDYDFSLSGNEIIVDSVEINSNRIESLIDGELKLMFEEKNWEE